MVRGQELGLEVVVTVAVRDQGLALGLEFENFESASGC